jgi:N-acetylglucosamine-6-phosphate deacetylase
MIGLHAPRLFNGETLERDRVALIDGRSIIAVLAPDAVPSGTEVETLPEGSLLAPGFVDLQVNGGGGILFNHDTSAGGLRRIAAAHARAGTTTMLPTLISGSRPQLLQALLATREAMAAGVPGIAGLHLEGPFIAPARAGIHPAAAIATLGEDDLAWLCAPPPGRLLLTLAPETVTPAQIAALARAGVIVFAGHTDASYAQARAGLDAGISGFTHLFNAMSPFAARAPGALGAALDDPACVGGIIVDLHHVHPASVRIAYAALGDRRLFLVSDAMATAASTVDHFVLDGEPIRLLGGRLTNAAGTLAGAHLTMAEAVRNAVLTVGLPLQSALRMATATPAAVIALPDRGRIAAGAAGDVVVLNRDLRVTAVWQNGTRLS